MNDQQLQDLCRFLSIAHHIPGRIRIRLDRSAFSSAAGFSLDLLETFLDSLERLEGIEEVRLNAPALSCTIVYDQLRIESDAWDALLEGRSHRTAGDLAALVLDTAEGLV